MDRRLALQLIHSTTPHERLQAARFFAKEANPGDILLLRSALTAESVSWVKKALAAGIDRCSKKVTTSAQASEPEPEIPEGVRREIQGRVIDQVTGTILHEIEPVVGLIRAAAAAEVPNFKATQVHEHLEHLTNVLASLQSLRQAASAPRIEEFDLPSLVRTVITAESARKGIDVSLYGVENMLCSGDPNLITLALANGIRNALDAVSQLQPQNRSGSIVVTWGTTDIDHWVAVIDKGHGLAISSETAFKMGRSTKKGHAGIGLSIARQAMESLDGQISLAQTQTGTRFEIRWYR